MTDDFDGFAYHRDRLRDLVWSGFFNAADWEIEAEDLTYDPDAEPHIGMLGEFVAAEFAAKRGAEAAWPESTDWDRLDAVFGRLASAGVLALHNAGYTTSDAHGDAWEIIKSAETVRWHGFVYYHGQDLERAVQKAPLFLGFDAVTDDPGAKRTVGMEIADALKSEGFEVEWDGDPERRMSITNLDWKKRTDWDASSGTSPPPPPTPLAAKHKPGFFRRLFG